METNIWDKLVTTYLFGMYVVDEWLIYTSATTYTLHPETELDKQEFYCVLVEELIEIFRPTRSRGGVNRAKKKYRSISGAR